jgi:hypothetical protein
MDRDEATILTNRLVGSYPSQRPPDPETYLTQLVLLLAEYPRWAGESAVQGWVWSKKWLPKVSQLRNRLEEEVRVLRDAAAWDAATAVSNNARLAAPPPPARPSYDELKALYGPTWGIEAPDTKPRKTAEQYRAELYAEFGRDLVDAVPDAPARPQEGKGPGPSAGHAARVAAELAERKAEREAAAVPGNEEAAM